MTYNPKQVYAIKKERENRIKKIAPKINNNPGIYVFYRDDESGLRMCYCGQARHLLERCSAHLGEYDHIGLSLKKRKFYSEDNPYGWKLTFKNCSLDKLDENERLTIKYYADKGFQLYNITSGSQGEGKTDIRPRKPPKGYRDGIAQGKITLARELTDISNKHLEIRIKPEKVNNQISIKAFEKFKMLIDENTYKE